MIGVGQTTLYKLRRDGVLRAAQIAGRTVWPVDELRALVERSNVSED